MPQEAKSAVSMRSVNKRDKILFIMKLLFGRAEIFQTSPNLFPVYIASETLQLILDPRVRRRNEEV